MTYSSFMSNAKECQNLKSSGCSHKEEFTYGIGHIRSDISAACYYQFDLPPSWNNSVRLEFNLELKEVATIIEVNNQIYFSSD